MGWGDCGQDSKGRNIGYVWGGICDEDGCKKQIDRGLSYACGDMHGETEWGCEKYFCENHLTNCIQTNADDLIRVCSQCHDYLMEQVKSEDSLIYDEDEGMVIEK